jgi:hypothetical protein
MDDQTRSLDEGGSTRRMSEAEKRALRRAKANLDDKFELPCAENFTRCLKERAGPMMLSLEESRLSEDGVKSWIVKLGGASIGIYTMTLKEPGKIPNLEYAGKMPNAENRYVLERVVLVFSKGERKDDFIEIPFP